MGYVYHKGMTTRSQEPSFESFGRVNQKQRTRTAIVTAARAILDRGESPTVARAAEDALVSRTTAYRYFPTQDSLLLELSLPVSIGEIDAVLDAPNDATTAESRLLDLADKANEYVAANETLFRNALRHYMDTWLATERAGQAHDSQLRKGRRREWISSALAPLRDGIPDEDYRRLEAALCLTMGGEAFVVLRDVCELDAQQAIAVAHWATEVILTAGLSAAREAGLSE